MGNLNAIRLKMKINYAKGWLKSMALQLSLLARMMLKLHIPLNTKGRCLCSKMLKDLQALEFIVGIEQKILKDASSLDRQKVKTLLDKVDLRIKRCSKNFKQLKKLVKRSI